MRVVVVSTWFPDGRRSGTAPFVLAHAHAIARNHDVEVVHVRLGSAGEIFEERFSGLPVSRVPLEPRRPYTAVNALARIRAVVRGADVVHSMAFSTLGVLAPLKPVIASRWVHTEHWTGVGFPGQISERWRRLAGFRHLLRLPRRVSAVSTGFAATVQHFARAEAVEVIPNVVDGSSGASPAPVGERVKLVAVGGLLVRKRPVLAVETVRVLLDRGTDVDLTWVGDGPLREETARRARELGVADRVRLVGTVPPSEVPAYLGAAHIFFLPTDFETFFVAGAEAMARGRPVVLPAGGPYSDYVDDSVGVLVTDDTPRGYAAAVETARTRFADVPAEHFRAAVLPRFGSESVARRFDEFYERALR